MEQDEVKQCCNCKHWIPNGGILDYGYCRANQMGYRKPNQKCEKKYEAK